MPWTTTLFVFAPLAGVLSDRIGSRPLIVTGLTLQGLGLGWVAYNVAHANPYTSSIVALVIAGCGTSLALPSGQNAVMNSVPAVYLGKAAGVFNSVRQLGGVLGIAIVSAVFAAQGSYAGPAAFRDGVAPALYVTAALALAGAVVGTLIPRVRQVVVVEPEKSAPEVAVDVAV